MCDWIGLALIGLALTSLALTLHWATGAGSCRTGSRTGGCGRSRGWGRGRRRVAVGVERRSACAGVDPWREWRQRCRVSDAAATRSNQTPDTNGGLVLQEEEVVRVVWIAAEGPNAAGATAQRSAGSGHADVVGRAGVRWVLPREHRCEVPGVGRPQVALVDRPEIDGGACGRGHQFGYKGVSVGVELQVAGVVRSNVFVPHPGVPGTCGSAGSRPR